MNKISLNRDWLPYMEKAFKMAEVALENNEVPVGAVIVDKSGNIIAQGYNQKEALNSVTAHAEIIAINQAAQKINNWRLTGCTMVVTLEPCLMCATAISMARMDRVVFGAKDEKAGGNGSLYSIHQEKNLLHQYQVVSGVLKNKCSKLLISFFKSKR